MKYSILSVSTVSLLFGYSQGFVVSTSPSSPFLTSLHYKNDIDAVERVMDASSIYEGPNGALGTMFQQQEQVIVDEEGHLGTNGSLFGCLEDPDPLGIAADILRNDYHP